MTTKQETAIKSIKDKLGSGHYKMEKVECPICDEIRFSDLADTDRYCLDCKNVICTGCGLVMINPRMDKCAYREFYCEEYRDIYTTVSIGEYFDSQYKRGKKLHRFLRKFDLPDDCHVLDVGCGSGGILSYLIDNGYTGFGIDIDIDKKFAEYGRNRGVLIYGLKTILWQYQLILYSHVLEHVLDLSTELRNIKKRLSSCGLVYVEAPGIKNLVKGYRGDLQRYWQNAHTYSFSLRTLKNLFAKHGFEMVYGDERIKAVFKVSNDYTDTTNYLENVKPSFIQTLRKT